MHENENMDLRTQIGQHFVCGFDGPTLEPSFIEAVKRHKIGNIILFARNIESKTQLHALCQEIQELVRSECGQDKLHHRSGGRDGYPSLPGSPTYPLPWRSLPPVMSSLPDKRE